jgi:hypothetical protein
LVQKWTEDRLEFFINRPAGDVSLIPARRAFVISLHGVREAVRLVAEVDGQPVAVQTSYDAATETLQVTGLNLGTASALRLVAQGDESGLLARRDRKRETLRHMLRFFKLHTGIRNRLAAEIDAILDDPALIAPYVPAMSPSQARALLEIITEAGLHTVRDTRHPALVVLWNNREDARITYRFSDVYLHFGNVHASPPAGGIVPRFAAFTPPGQAWRRGALGEHVHRTQWRAQVDYLNVLSVAEGHQEQTP